MATYENWKTEVQKKQLNFIQSYIQYIVITTEYIQTSTVVEMVYTVVYCCCYVLFFLQLALISTLERSLNYVLLLMNTNYYLKVVQLSCCFFQSMNVHLHNSGPRFAINSAPGLFFNYYCASLA